MSQAIVLTVTEVGLVNPGGPARVCLSLPYDPNDEAPANEKRAAGLTLIVPLEEAQTFYVIGASFELQLSPAAEEPNREPRGAE